ncbi:MAG: hypothetical protein JRN15_09840 [Nitrososphaerota archaeon]|nr:hypothetical protein [Nitrososphaerota archaeon]
MYITWAFDRGREIVAVIPTISTSRSDTQNLLSFLDRSGVDSVCVVDSGKGFNFSRSMNAGIKETLARHKPRLIILSNDDVSDIKGLDKMVQYLLDHGLTYVVPYVNGKRDYCTLTASRLRFIINYAIFRFAPLYALKLSAAVIARKGDRKLLLGAPASRLGGFLNIQPFVILHTESLMLLKKQTGCFFDEGFLNRLEDYELAYRLNKCGIRGITNSEWSIRHVMGSSLGRKAMRENNEIANNLYLTIKYTSE